MTNEQMIAGRFARWHNARRRIAFIRTNLEAGRAIWICTMTRKTKYSVKHIEMFKATKAGALVQRGKSWDCIDYCQIVAQ